jgi:hypothetical protein
MEVKEMPNDQEPAQLVKLRDPYRIQLLTKGGSLFGCEGIDAGY